MVQLFPLTRDQYDKLLLENLSQQNATTDFSCSCCRKHYLTQPAYSQHLRSKKHIEKSQNIKQKDDKPKANFIAPNPSNSLNSCLFCNRLSNDIDSNLNHMQKNHGLLIPSRNHLKSIEGLLQILYDIIHRDHACLYCNRSFRTAESAQTHMIHLNHCKILFENNQEYYDISDLSFDKNRENTECVLANNGLEMMLNDGRIIGHRSLCQNYKQKYEYATELGIKYSDRLVIEGSRSVKRIENASYLRAHNLQMRQSLKGKKDQRSARPNNCVRKSRVGAT
jgi:hypothetical protein